MKFFAALSVVASIASLAAAQGVAILSPPAQSTFAPGDKFVVDIDRHDSLTPSKELSVAIGLLNCAQQQPDSSATCDGIDLTQGLGSVLYAGPYTPQVRPGGDDLFQNFTVQVPEGFPAGPALLSVTHFALVGAVSWPMLQILNETVNISQ
ncbi:hypothetical protein PYCCODRAFT_1464970 [Trametes coccinea BRFM310]|uniref:Phosphatidylglycerol/phosphatidylinositol transfer protein n=1 Tax=Trametes coccinea (strain BRFM310) TaxID=1353009 RepID=A0A1Y2IX01_TRAC3|nr:hypothetical protein PYCCODRAFT_1464970 [Trametes coccinea BRFM310]